MAPFDSLHFRTYDALRLLSDSDLSVELPIIDGRAPGTWDLLQSFIPPNNVERNDVAARFMVSLEDTMGVEIQLMVSLLADEIGHTFALGFIAHSQSQDWHLDPVKLFAAARYHRRRRRGTFIVTREVHKILLEQTRD
jgi:hypothetical protein